MMIRARLLVAVLSSVCATLVSQAALAQSSTATTSPARTTAFARNWTRLEHWSFFEPRPGGGDPEYTDVGNRFRFGIERVAPRYEFLGALQYVQFGGLPTRAFDPGAFGTGALYFAHSGRTDSRQLYVRYLRLRLKSVAPGLTVELGRMGFADGAEITTGDWTIDRVKQLRATSRLIGEFEWSLYERAFDGGRLDWTRRGWTLSATGLRPTQGGFEDAAGLRIDDLGLLTMSLTARPGALLPRTDTQVFFYRYDDERAVRQRPDNSGRAAERADIQINTVGTTLVGAYPTAIGIADTLFWVAGQTGSWYEQAHHGLALGLEGGHRWPRAGWQPWIRGGWLWSSGDPDPADRTHDTFFQMLPTGRKLAQSATYSLMNLSDLFVQLYLSPRRQLETRVELHRIQLVEDADRWYSGSGATERAGSRFGFSGRPSLGATGLGTVLEGSAAYTVNSHWTFNGYVGLIYGGDVVRRTFAGDRLTFAYVENILTF